MIPLENQGKYEKGGAMEIERSWGRNEWGGGCLKRNCMNPLPEQRDHRTQRGGGGCEGNVARGKSWKTSEFMHSPNQEEEKVKGGKTNSLKQIIKVDYGLILDNKKILQKFKLLDKVKPIRCNHSQKEERRLHFGKQILEGSVFLIRFSSRSNGEKKRKESGMSRTGGGSRGNHLLLSLHPMGKIY